MPALLLQAGIFAGAGVSKIRLTGGEPTLRRDLVELTHALRALPGVSGVGLTTNGLTLSRKLEALQTAGGGPPVEACLLQTIEYRAAFAFGGDWRC